MLAPTAIEPRRPRTQGSHHVEALHLNQRKHHATHFPSVAMSHVQAPRMNSEDSDSDARASAPTPSGEAHEAESRADLTSRPRCPFPIVGIGASAGGIDAL